MKSIATVTILLFIGVAISAQVPFECDGRMFRVMEQGAGTVLQEVVIDYQSRKANYLDLNKYIGMKVNGICYRPADNMIYGVLLGPVYGLCRIDGSYVIERLRDLPLPSNLLFVAGDISPDERYLVLLGYSPEEPTNLLALVDLESPDYDTQILPLFTEDTRESILCADIAFHPTTGTLYGYNHKHKRLVTIDLARRSVNNTRFPETTNLKGNMPTLFFDAFGNLFGIGSNSEFVSNRILYSFDLETGLARQEQVYGYQGNQDGCSCPYKINVLNEINQSTVFPCTVAEFDITIINRSPFEHTGVTLTDTFPTGMTIQAIVRNPFGGKVLSGVGTNILNIDNMELPLGVDTLTLMVEVPEDLRPGLYRNQVFLKNVSFVEDSTGDVIVSDDPKTVLYNDPTKFQVSGLQVNFGEDELLLCPGDTIVLDPNINGAEEYLWNTGETQPVIPVHRAGYYELSVTTGCQEAVGGVQVQEASVELDLGRDIVIESGEQIELVPSLFSERPIRYYFWTETGNGQTLDCNTCESVLVAPTQDQHYQLEIANDIGCRVRDLVAVEVAGFRTLAPNAFSPNGDGRNDVFFSTGPSGLFYRAVSYL